MGSGTSLNWGTGGSRGEEGDSDQGMEEFFLEGGQHRLFSCDRGSWRGERGRTAHLGREGGRSKRELHNMDLVWFFVAATFRYIRFSRRIK